MLPHQLENDSFRFIILDPKSKKPAERGWSEGFHTYKYNNPYFSRTVFFENNYGVLCGHGNLVIIDADAELTATLIKKNLPAGFVVKSPSKRGFGHFYFVVNDLTPEHPRVFLENESEHLGEIISHGAFAVGAGSTHPDGGKYVVSQDLTIPEITISDIVRVFKPYMKAAAPKKVQKIIYYDTLGLAMVDLVDISKFKLINGQYMGAHPIHGSQTGHNFCINPKTNSWFCFRHWAGGGPIQYIAVLKGFCTCEEVSLR